MKADHGTTPIPLPAIVDDPRWIGRFSREVRKSIAALRDRKIIVRGRVGRGGKSHPWKVTSNGDDTVTIAAGRILGYYLTYANAAPGTPPAAWGMSGPDSIVLGPGGSYAGTSSQSIPSGEQYVYALLPRNGPTNEYCEVLPEELGNTVTSELYDDIEPAITDAVTIAVSSSAPASYTPTAGNAAVCLAKVTNTSSVVTVDEQYVIDNPTVFVPVVGGFSDLSL